MGNTAFRRLEHGRLAASHMRFKGSVINGLLYIEGLPRFLGFGLVKRL
jgi:hypothetical protein